jgi:hypothetical protein
MKLNGDRHLLKVEYYDLRHRLTSIVHKDAPNNSVLRKPGAAGPVE